MATISERLQYLLRLDAAQAIKAVDQFGKQAGDAIDGSSGKLDRLGGNMMKFGAGAMATAGVAGKALWSIGAGASDLNESINAVEKTFGDAAEGVLALGENAAKSIGLSRTEFAQLATGFASFASTVAGEGGDVVATVQEMTTRAADFASVLNMDVSRAVGLFQTSLAGEAEAMRRFGIDVSAVTVEQYALANGLAASKSELTESIKVQARYGVIMAATESMAGDFADTSDDLANSQRILAADMKNLKDNVGAGLLPAMKFLVTTAGDATNAFSNMSPEFQKLIGGAAGATVGILAVGGAASFIIGSLIKMRTNLKLAQAAMVTFSRAHPLLLAATVAVAAATAIAAAAWFNHSKKQKDAQDKVESLTTAIQANITELKEQADLLGLIEGGAVAAVTGIDLMIESVIESDKWTDEMSEGLLFLHTNMERMTPVFVGGQEALDGYTRKQLMAAGASEEMSDALIANSLASGRAFSGSNALMSAAQVFINTNGDLIDSLNSTNNIFDLYNVAAVDAARASLIDTAARREGGAAAVSHAEDVAGVSVEMANNVEIAEMLIVVEAALAQGIINSKTAVQSLSTANEELAKSGGLVAESSEAIEAAKEAEKEALEGIQGPLQDVVDKYDEMVSAANDAYDETVNAAQEWRDGINDSFQAGAESFDTFQVSADSTAKDYIASLDSTIWGLTAWQGNLDTIGDATSADFAAHLATMGVEGQNLITGLADPQNAAELQTAFDKWVESGSLAAKNMAVGFDKEAEIAAFAAKLAEEKRLTAIREAKTAAYDESVDIGLHMMSGTEDGITDNSFKLSNAMTAAINAAIAAGVLAAENASPSKKTKREIGKPMIEGVAVGVTEGAPAVASAMSDAVDDAAEAGAESSLVFREEVGAPIIIGVEEGIAEEAPRVSDALVQAIENAESEAVKAAKDLSDAVLDEFEALVKAADDALSGIFDGINRADKVEGLVESVSDAERSLAEAQENLTEVQLDGESTAKDLALAQEKVSDAAEALRDANMRLTEETIANTLGTEEQQAAWESAATAAGLTAVEVRGLRDAYYELATAQKALNDAKVLQASIDADIATKIANDAAKAQATVDRFNELGGQGLLLGKDLTDVASLSSNPAQQLAMMESIIARVERFFSQFVPKAPTPQSVPKPAAGRPSDIPAITSNKTGEPPKLGRMLPDADMSAITAAVERGMVQGFKGIRQNERAS